MSLFSLIFRRESLAKRSGFCNINLWAKSWEVQWAPMSEPQHSIPPPPSSRGLASILTEAESQSMLDLWSFLPPILHLSSIKPARPLFNICTYMRPPQLKKIFTSVLYSSSCLIEQLVLSKKILSTCQVKGTEDEVTTRKLIPEKLI